MSANLTPIYGEAAPKSRTQDLPLMDEGTCHHTKCDIPLIYVPMATKLGFTLTSTTPFNPSIQRPFVSVSSSSSTRVESFQISGRQLCLRLRRRRLLVLPARATADQQGKVEKDDVVDSKILPYCSIDNKKKSLGELEQDFLQALQMFAFEILNGFFFSLLVKSFYYDGKAIMSNEEFDNLKEELMWEGSSVVMLSSDEQKFLEASMAYVSGKPILTDQEYDDLKMRLKTEGSDIVVEGPRCSLRTRKVYSDLTVDYLKMFLLNVPATVVALAAFFFLDDLTGFEITYLLELPEPFSFIFTWFAAVPAVVYLAQALTKLIIKDVLILKGPCPNCGTENLSFFGTILSISNGGSTNNLKCSNCGTPLVYDSKSRLITLPDGSNA
ncbi:hypothetical protein DVH24_001305 [Malus domestica]|uniref:PGR5-like protein 1A, chloroplastic n=1 Tax=Malus domestica TaxID=3750 RepID=A0A498K0D1_MALDO|nr:hypothetical protein DVH24_001305 [Malus domestica]